jgi:hypothetical protein
MAGQAVGIDPGEKGVFIGPRGEKGLEVILHRPSL